MKKIKIKDYLTNEEMKEIIKEEFRNTIRKDSEKTLSNLSYDLGIGFISELLTDDELKNLKKEIKSELNNKSTISFMIFYSGVDYKSKAIKIIEETVNEEQINIENKIKNIINNIDFESLIEQLKDGEKNEIIIELLKLFIKYKKGE